MKIDFKILWERTKRILKDCRAEIDMDALAQDLADIGQRLSVKIGSTTYLVSSFFKQDSKSQSTALDKIQRLIDKDTSQAS